MSNISDLCKPSIALGIIICIVLVYFARILCDSV